MNRLSVFFSAVMAGAAVAFGGTVFLALENKVIGAGLFTVGLFLVCEYGFHLFTGKVCSALRSGLRYALDLPVIWLGNFVGAWLTARIILLTRMASLSKKALALSNVKAGDSLVSLFFLGALNGRTLLCLTAITAGNACGGILFCEAVNWRRTKCAQNSQ